MSTRTANPHAHRPRRGHGVMEAALVLPILIAFSMGLVEFGQFFYVKHTINAASRDGARTAIIGSSTHAQAVDAVDNTMQAAGYTTQQYSVTFTNAAGAAIPDVTLVPRGSSIRVTVSANFGAVGVRPLGVIPATKPVVGITTMLKE